MSYFNEATEEITFKLVYWGPGHSGKTSNLAWLQRHLPSAACGRLAQLATETERTLFFEFLPLTLGEVGGLATQFHLYTVPGQASYQDGRRAILRGADGVVFVADARAEHMDGNLEALADLRAGLSALGSSLQQLPHVFQYNWCDAPSALPLADLRQALGASAHAEVAATATDGTGVLDTLKSVGRAVLSGCIA